MTTRITYKTYTVHPHTAYTSGFGSTDDHVFDLTEQIEHHLDWMLSAADNLASPFVERVISQAGTWYRENRDSFAQLMKLGEIRSDVHLN